MKLAFALSFGVASLLASQVASAQSSCPDGGVLCGLSHCAPEGEVCCASVGHEELSCPAGETCTGDGGCAGSGGTGGSDAGAGADAGTTCAQGGALTLASCGGDTCGCSAACKAGSDCESGCCTTAGLCAPACVCLGSGQLYLACNTSGAGFGPVAHKGCGAAPGAPSGRATGASLLAALALALGLARRRRQAC